MVAHQGRPSIKQTSTSQMNFLILFVLGFFALNGCERAALTNAPEPPTTQIAAAPVEHKDQEVKTSVRIKYLEGEQPTAETIVAELADYTVTVAEFEQAANLGRLFGPDVSEGKFEPVPPDRLAVPTVQFTTTRAILARKAILAEAKRREIVITEEDLKTLYRTREEFAGLKFVLEEPNFPANLEPLNISLDDFWNVGREHIARQRLADAIVSDLSEKDIWEAYQFEQSTARVAAVEVSNVPSSAEIDAFVAQHEDRITTFFNENERRFRNPQRVVVDTLSGDLETLERAQKMLESGATTQAVALETRLELRSNVRMVRQENSRAFAAETGAVGLEKRSSPYLWKVVRREESQASELTRPLKREIAAELLRTESLTPGAKARLEAARKVLLKLKDTEESITKATESLRAADLKLVVLPPFQKSPAGSVPVFGLAPELLETAFKLKAGKTSKPFLSRERGFVIHVLSRHQADRKLFEAEKETIRKRVEDELRPSAVDHYIQSVFGATQLNLHPLGVKFGIIQKDP